MSKNSFELYNSIDHLKFALGNALLRWQGIETLLFIIAHGILSSDYKTNSIVFFHSKSFENKLYLVDKLLNNRLSQHDYQNNWRSINKELKSLAEFRNSLAHFEHFFVKVENIKQYPSAFPVGISPNFLDIAAVKNGKVKSLSIELITKQSNEFQFVVERMAAFAIKYVTDIDEKILQLPLETIDWWQGMKGYASVRI